MDLDSTMKSKREFTIKMGGKKPDITVLLDSTITISELRQFLYSDKQIRLNPNRQAFRTEPKGRLLRDEMKLANACPDGVLYFKDLGAQVGWSTVFLCEYAGPLIIYLIFYFRPHFIYLGHEQLTKPHKFVEIAASCWTFHYTKRILETLFVHNFSHATMPRRSLMKNCIYYWGCTAAIAYFANHPLYTLPMFGEKQFLIGLAIFCICEFGNFSIHVALSALRPPGTKTRAIPYPGWNPFTWLFYFVSCPNYTYEVGAWLGFAIMTQTLTSVIFMLLGFYQMAVWASGKHRAYKKEFKDYPKGRKAIVPFFW